MTELRFDRLAFTGGSRINQVGSLDDLLCFFEITRKYAAPLLNDVDRFLLLDRFYKRYVRIDETSEAVEAMRRVQSSLSHISASDIAWDDYNIRSGRTTLDLQEDTVAGVVSDFFRAFYLCAEAAVYCNNDDTHPFFRPVKISRSDFGSLYREDNRPVEEYDTLDGSPFWLAGT